MRVLNAVGPRGLCLLAMFGVALPAAAQQMSKADQALYDQMVKSAGMDPAMVHQAQNNVDSSRKWSEGKDGLVHYHIVGTYKGTPNVIGGSDWIGRADVTDRVDIDLAWKLDEAMMVGTPLFKNYKSVVGPVRNGEPKCAPPVLTGEFELFDLAGIKQGLSGTLEMKVRTKYPAASVPQDCTGARVTVPASVVEEPEQLVVLSPVALSGAVKSPNVRISPDKKSMSTTSAGWTWTYTPSVKN